MDENNLEEMSGIREVENMGGGDLNMTPEQPVTPSYEIPRLTPEEPDDSSSNKGPVILLIATIVVILGLVAYGAMSFSKSKTEKFFGLFADDYMFGMANEVTEMMMKDGKYTTEFSVDPSDFSQFVDTEIPINRLAMVSEQVTSGADFSGKVYLDVDSTELVTFKYAKTGETFGITVPDLMNEYFVVKNENLKALARKFGASEEDIAQIPDKLTVEEIEKLMETSEIDTEKYVNILERYVEPISELIESNLIEEEKELKIKENTFTLTRHSLELTEKDLYDFAKKFLEIAKDDEELYNALKEDEPTFEVESFEEWKEGLTEGITSIDEMLATADDVTVMFRLSAYVDGKDTMGIEISFPEENVSLRLATLNEKKSSYTEVVAFIEEGEIKIITTTIAGDNEYTGDIKVAADMGAANININIAKYKMKYSKDATLEKLDALPIFVLNDETMESIEAKLEEIQKNATNYITTITEKAPESLKTMLGDMSDIANDYEVPDYDYDYDYDYDEEPFAIKGSQVYILSDSNEVYSKMKLGMTRDEIIALMGEPDYDETFGEMTFLDWDDEYYNSHSVIIEEGVVTEISRDLASASYENIQLSTELGTEIEDLESVLKNVKEGMDLLSVEKVLGNKYFESERNNYGEVTYTWYDKAENYVTISFDENGEVWYVGSVWGSY